MEKRNYFHYWDGRFGKVCPHSSAELCFLAFANFVCLCDLSPQRGRGGGDWLVMKCVNEKENRISNEY